MSRPSDNGTTSDEPRCFLNIALIRSDGKLKSGIEQIEVDCGSCKTFALVNKGYLEGIDVTETHVFPPKCVDNEAHYN